MVRRVYRERPVVMLAWGRAVLMQLAHPLVAAGIMQHSTYRQDPQKRFFHTLEAAISLVFGNTEEAMATVKHINAIHERVNGSLEQTAGRFTAGTRYDATDPPLLLWVHATLVDSELFCFSRYVAPLSYEEQEQYHQERKVLGPLFGIPDDLMPQTIDDLRTYIDDVLESDIAVGSRQKDWAMSVLYPDPWFIPRPLWEPAVTVTIGLLPDRIREAYELSYSAARRGFYAVSPILAKAVLPVTPKKLKYW